MPINLRDIGSQKVESAEFNYESSSPNNAPQLSLTQLVRLSLVRYKKGYLMKSIVTIFLLFTMTITAPGCHKETEQDRVKKVITNIHKAAEGKDIKKIINNLSKTYNDPQGYNYDTIKGLLLAYFSQYPKISIYITELEISAEDISAKTEFQAVLTSRRKTGSAADKTPKLLGIYVFVVSLKNEPDGWKVTSATWVGEEDVINRGGH